MNWDEVYEKTECLWGKGPEPLLREYSPLVPKGKVLDLGLGEGRNTIFFASQGYEVEGVDISQTAVERCLTVADQEGFKVRAEVKDLTELAIPEGRYSLIVAAWVLNFLRKSELEEIAAEIRIGLKPNGLAYVGVFNLDDPGYRKAREKSEPVEENTFYLPSRDLHMHYFTEEEIKSLFSDLETIHFSQGTSLDIGHGEPHYHGFIQYLGRKAP